MDKKSEKQTDSQDLKLISEEEAMRLELEPDQRTKISKTGVTSNLHSDHMFGKTQSTLANVDQEQGWGEGSKRSMVSGWWILAGLALLGIGLWAALSVYKAQDKIDEVVDSKETLVRASEEELEEAREFQTQIEFAVREYFAADTIEKKLVYSRQPERVKALMEKFYQEEELLAEEFVKFSKFQTVALSSRPFILAIAVTDKGKKKVILEQMKDGSFLVDWETHVCYQPIAWNDFLKQRRSEPVNLRVYLRRDNFYAFEFGNERDYQCYRLTDLSRKEDVYAYVKRGSETMFKIERVLRGNSSGSVALILKLRFPKESASKRAVIVDDCIESRWVYVVPPIDE